MTNFYLPLSTKFADFVGSIRTSSAKERVFVSGPQIGTVTAIDALNWQVDKETRKYSAVKTFVQMSVGTFAGLLSRYAGQKFGEFLANTDVIKPVSKELAENIKTNPTLKKEFACSVGKTVAVATVLVSIVVFEVPFIERVLKMVMNKIYPENQDNKNSKDSKNGSTSRKYYF